VDEGRRVGLVGQRLEDDPGGAGRGEFALSRRVSGGFCGSEMAPRIVMPPLCVIQTLANPSISPIIGFAR
jgi:hypothetical protein